MKAPEMPKSAAGLRSASADPVGEPATRKKTPVVGSPRVVRVQPPVVGQSAQLLNMLNCFKMAGLTALAAKHNIDIRGLKLKTDVVSALKRGLRLVRRPPNLQTSPLPQLQPLDQSANAASLTVDTDVVRRLSVGGELDHVDHHKLQAWALVNSVVDRKMSNGDLIAAVDAYFAQQRGEPKADTSKPKGKKK